MTGGTVWFGVKVGRVDVGIAMHQGNEVVSDAILHKMVTCVDVAGFSWDTNSKCQLDSREVINVYGGRTSLREANGSEVVSEAKSKADGRGEAVVFRGAWVNGWLVLRIRLAKKWCGFGADG
jgi:hypothetical protein